MCILHQVCPNMAIIAALKPLTVSIVHLSTLDVLFLLTHVGVSFTGSNT